jgi:hypothetical protein
MERKRDITAPVGIAVVLLLLPVLYVGSYYALVVPTQGSFLGSARHPVSAEMFPDYRIVGRYGDSFYKPIHNMDRELRPATWADKVGDEVELFIDAPRL